MKTVPHLGHFAATVACTLDGGGYRVFGELLEIVQSDSLRLQPNTGYFQFVRLLVHLWHGQVVPHVKQFTAQTYVDF